MPSAIPAKLPKQSSTSTSTSGDPPASANAPGASDAAPIIAAIENKIRNLEKRKTKLVRIEEDLKKGKEVTKEQKEAASHIGEVEQQLEVMKELLKTANDSVKQQLKQKKQERKAEQKERVQAEIARLRELLQIQDVLSTLGHDDVRNDFKKGANGAVKLSDFEIEKLDELFRKLCPCHEDLTADQNWGTYLQDSSLIAYSILTNSTNSVPFYEGKSYRDLRGMVDSIVACGYFETKFGRSQSPEQAKSEAASTISNPEDSTRVVGDKSEEHQAAAIGQQTAQSTNLPAFHDGNGAAASAGGAPLSASTSPPRQVSPSTLIGPSGQPPISFLQDDQSGGGAYGPNTATFEAPAINASLPYSSETLAFVNSNVGGYNPASAVLYGQQQQSNMASTQLAGYSLQFDSNLPMGGSGGTEQIIPMKPLDPNAPTFVSHSETPMFATTLVSAAPQMHHEPAVAQYYGQAPADDQRVSQELVAEENLGDATNDGSATQHPQEGREHRYYGGPRRGGYRGGERGAYNAGRGRFGGGGYRGERRDGGQGQWSGQQHEGGQGGYGYRGRGGYRGGGGGGFRHDESGGQGRGGRGGGQGYNRRGGGFEQRGGGPRRGGGAEA